MPTVTCHDGAETSEACLDRVADAEGFATVYPDGTAAFLGLARTWNAGGGEEGWRCVSGDACRDGVDDLAYFDDLFDDLARAVPLGPVFATGLSNGAAMSHRLACARADRIAAIAPVAGANQVAAVQGCEPSRAVPVLQIHGTDDPCWGYEGGSGACLQDDGDAYVSVADTVSGWAERNGCDDGAVEEAMPDAADDGMTSTRTTWQGCEAAVEHIAIENGGHTWPGGQQYSDEEKIGPVTTDWSASQVMWDFFARVPSTTE